MPQLSQDVLAWQSHVQCSGRLLAHLADFSSATADMFQPKPEPEMSRIHLEQALAPKRVPASMNGFVRRLAASEVGKVLDDFQEEAKRIQQGNSTLPSLDAVQREAQPKPMFASFASLTKGSTKSPAEAPESPKITSFGITAPMSERTRVA